MQGTNQGIQYEYFSMLIHEYCVFNDIRVFQNVGG
jgi:hypothetical protein